MRFLEIQENDAKQRMDRFLQKYLPQAPKSLLQKWLRTKKIKCNGKRTERDYILETGDRLSFYLYDEVLAPYERKKRFYRKGKLSVVCEDSDLIILDKPKGVLTHASQPKDYGHNLVDYLTEYLIEKQEYCPRFEHSFRPCVVNRLDFNTEGLVIGAKNHEAAMRAAAWIKEGNIKKHYFALCEGNISKKRILDMPLLREGKRMRMAKSSEEGIFAKTEIMPLAYGDNVTLLEVILHTGRYHQIRAHLSSIGHPLVGDSTYGAKPLKKGCPEGQRLFAYALHFSDSIDSLFWRGKTVVSERAESWKEQVLGKNK